MLVGHDDQITNESIAIIGMNCCFPGGAHDYHEFWQLLLDGKDAIKPIPRDRWDSRKYYNSESNSPGKTSVQAAGFLDRDITAFDPLFFGISPREAESMDPQQRLLLEVCWQAFEDAGIDMPRLYGSNTAVFIGGFCLDNQLMQLSTLNRDLIDSHTATSSSMTMLASRLSYVFDLTGPCMTLDTACSSSLTALHYACQSLITKEAKMAIAGGVNLIFKPENTIVMSKGQFLSPDERCKTFSADANGYVRGEGAGIVILKPLSNAIADGDRIHAVIAATGVNQDGQTMGITLPNGESQKRLMHQVYQKAQVSLENIGYIEAHGTGTQAGDVTEASSINALFKNYEKPRYVGSVKTNIGHLEAAAGVAGLIKTVLCLKHKKIPANLHFSTPNPNINFDKIQVPTKTIEWKQQEPYYAAINSFGYGGSNAHALVHAFTPPKTIKSKQLKTCLMPVTFSSPSKEGLTKLLQKTSQWLEENPGLTIADIAHSFNIKKTHFTHRHALWAHTTAQLHSKITELLDNQFLLSEPQTTITSHEIAFVCSGMGPQHAAMGQQLFEQEKVYKNTVLECDKIYQSLTGSSILDELYLPPHQSNMSSPNIAQVANFILQVSLGRLLYSWGIKPAAIIGHSVGEIAAFHLSGALSLNDAMRISYHRARLQTQLLGKGEMLAVNLSPEEIKPLIENTSIGIAAINTSNSLTLSGNKHDIAMLEKQLDNSPVFYRALNVNLAYHSSQMESIKEEFLSVIDTITYSKPSTTLYSTVTGQQIDPLTLDSSYWWLNARQPVLFHPAIDTMLEDGFSGFIEVGPHPVLRHYLNEVAKESGELICVFATLNKKQPAEVEYLKDNIGEIYCHGITLNFQALGNDGGQFIATPYQPWLKEKYWRESLNSREDRLGTNNSTWLYQPLNGDSWQVELNQSFFPSLFDHKIFNMPVLPAASTIEAALSVALGSFDSTTCLIENLSFDNMLIIEQSHPQTIQLDYQPQLHKLSFHCINNAYQQTYAHGFIYPMGLTQPKTSVSISNIKKHFTQYDNIPKLYAHFSVLGLGYSNDFQSIKELYCSEKEVVAKLQVSSPKEQNTPIIPALVDGAFQSLIALHSQSNKAYLPDSINKISYYQAMSETSWSHAKILKLNDKRMLATLSVYNEKDELCLKIEGLCLKAITKKSDRKNNLTYRLQWLPQAITTKEKHKKQGFLLIGNEKNAKLIDAYLKENHSHSIYAEYNDEQLIIKNQDSFAEPFPITQDNWGDLNVQQIIYITDSSLSNSVEAYSTQHWSVIAHIKQLTTLSSHPMKFTLVTHMAQNVLDDIENLNSASLAYLARVIENENPHIKIKSIDTDRETKYTHWLQEIIAADHPHDHVAFRHNQRYIQKLQPCSMVLEKRETKALNDCELELAITQSGRIDSLSYKESNQVELGENDIKIKVYASALNYKDILKVSNQLANSITENTFFGDSLGMEVSGVIVDMGCKVKQFEIGESVIAPLPGNFSSFATLHQDYVLNKPSTLTFEQAPILTVFITAYRALIQIANIKPAERILIHCATGGVGLAAIQIAKRANAEIYATAGTPEKRRYLEQLGITHIYDSRSCDFKEAILNDTNNYGVDVVLNSISGDTLIHSLNLLAPYGRFIEIGKKDIAENNPLPLHAFNQNITFASIDIDRMLVDRMDIISPITKTLLALFERKELTPLPIEVFPAQRVRDAFKFMAQNKHMGKVIIDYKDQKVDAIITNNRSRINKEACYIITGGCSGFGLQVAHLLVKLGAQRIYLLSRRGHLASQDYDHRFHPKAIDISNKQALKGLFAEIAAEGLPLKGIIHSAMVLDDNYLTNLNQDSFEKVLTPKVAGAMNLHQLSQNLSLDFFIQFSSISALIGNVGQANYIVANGFLDALCHYRMRQNLPATSINWGVLGEVGVVANDSELSKLLQSSGINAIDIQTALNLLEKLLLAPSQHLGFFDIDWNQWAKSHPTMQKKSLFDELINLSENTALTQGSQHVEIKQLAGKERIQALAKSIGKALAMTLKINFNHIRFDESINQYGVDSILAIELVNQLREQLEISLSPTDFMDGKSILQLSETLSVRFDS